MYFDNNTCLSVARSGWWWWWWWGGLQPKLCFSKRILFRSRAETSVLICPKRYRDTFIDKIFKNCSFPKKKKKTVAFLYVKSLPSALLRKECPLVTKWGHPWTVTPNPHPHPLCPSAPGTDLPTLGQQRAAASQISPSPCPPVSHPCTHPPPSCQMRCLTPM